MTSDLSVESGGTGVLPVIKNALLYEQLLNEKKELIMKQTKMRGKAWRL